MWKKTRASREQKVHIRHLDAQQLNPTKHFLSLAPMYEGWSRLKESRLEVNLSGASTFQESIPLLLLTGLLGAELIFLRSLSMLFTNLIRDGCRVKLGFPRVEKRFLAQFSFADCSASKEAVRGMTGLEPENGKGQCVKAQLTRLPCHRGNQNAALKPRQGQRVTA